MSTEADVFDLAIVGGGCAGLSLAAQLADAGSGCPRVLVVERRSAYRRDRTWCGWTREPHRFSSCVDHRWSAWAIQHAGQLHRMEARAYAYEHIRSDAFYRAALAAVRGNANVQLELGAALHRIGQRDGCALIELDGRAFRAKRVVDSRPRARPARGTALLQHFVGREVETQRPVFDPGAVTLMDFDVDQADGLHFMYVLPFSPRRALIESTVISPEVLPTARYEERIARYAEERFGSTVQRTVYAESGAIPMLVEDESAEVRGAFSDGLGAKPEVLRIGTAGGAVRASSGYAFHAIQRDAVHLAGQVLAGRAHLAARRRSRTDGWMDRVFLSFLQRSPDRAAGAFSSLARGVDADVFARFMMERCQPLDRLKVVGCMPKLRFAREALAVTCA